MAQMSIFDAPQEPEPEEDITGRVAILDGREFKVVSVSSISGDAHLSETGSADYPVGRVEKAAYVRRILKEQERDGAETREAAAPEQAAAEPEPVKPSNFRITDDDLGAGGAKAKYRMNAEAIKTLKLIESEGRNATPEEQETLSRYVGWGGIPQAFDEGNPDWAKEHEELKTLLTPEEYAGARATTLNAHYTSPTVIKAMYKAIEGMGFRGGNILEPSCGAGNFMGLLPDSMKGSKVYGVEIDSVTGRIAKALYPENDVNVCGFEETNHPDSFFDLAIGNVPFGGYGVADKHYDRHRFNIHDYFFAKAIDKVRPGGVIAFVTSKGTMDKKNPSVRRYIAQRAELIGAVRLPNDAFMRNAGTGVTSDIIFLQKRDRAMDMKPDWVHLGKTGSGIPVNSYFADNPDMMLGEMEMDSSMYGDDQGTALKPFPGADLALQLEGAIANIHAEIAERANEDGEPERDESIPADPDVRNFSYAEIGGRIFFRENSRMAPQEMTLTARERVLGMMGIRDCVRTLISIQTEGGADDEIGREQARLGSLYDSFTKKHGLINSRGNAIAFREDGSYPLLCALEVIGEDGALLRKADMFTKRTIRPVAAVDSVDTPAEALAVSVAEKAGVDMAFMAALCGRTEAETFAELRGAVFCDTSSGAPVFRTADDFLSGDVRQKLKTWDGMLRSLEEEPESGKENGADGNGGESFAPDPLENARFNAEALRKVQPEDLTAPDIDVRLGATWLPKDVVEDFMFTLLETPVYARRQITVRYSPVTAAWSIEGKSRDAGNVKASGAYGTRRMNAYRILEETLNLKDARVFDYTEDADGKRTAVLNKKETMIAQQKQEAMKAAFADCVWKDPERRGRLVEIYNERFNSVRPREYDGGHIAFGGMNPEIRLHEHQRNAVARILYGGNTLLAHVVGAGKTFEMAAAAMESKRLGLCSKSLFVVPNHLTEQWASEFLQLYPAANILVSTKRDFERKRRRKFCSRIATGEYDAVIIGHSQFEKIPLSPERQRMELESQIDDIADGIMQMKAEKAERFGIKQLEKTKKSLETKLARLNDQSRKDDVVTFEELGVDRLFIDEAHYYKNLYCYTKMRNVGGIAQTEAQKSSDLYMKCRYLDDATGGRGIVFATGTPISNSMVEMFTMQRYLQRGELEKRQLAHFDAWASTFGETVTAIELAPEGTGYRAKTRFARFFNLPELMAMFRQVADIRTADTLDLPVPKARHHSIAVKPSEAQRELVASLSERAEKVRSKESPPHVDNMLVITNDGRKIALDERLINPLLPDREDGKASVIAGNVLRIWEETREQRLTQLVFCDLSTPKTDGGFSVYGDIRKKLMDGGVPEEEIAFIHSANTETQKKEMFAKVRSGQIRVLMGSTQKMGAGTNVQDRLIAIHDCDCPWRPSDLEQRSGRIIRQGNRNPEVDIYRYVTEGTFDSYLYQLVENKQRFIGQVMTSRSPVRSAEDVDEQVLSYAEIKALATGNPHIKEKMELDMQAARLKLARGSFLDHRYALEDRLAKGFPEQKMRSEELVAGYERDIAMAESHAPKEDGFAPMEVMGTTHGEAKKAGEALLAALSAAGSTEYVPVGKYRGFEMAACFDPFDKAYVMRLGGALRHKVALGTDARGNITRIDNLIASLPEKLAEEKERLENTEKQIESAKEEVKKPFPQEDELKRLEARLAELNSMLNMDEKSGEAADLEPPEQDDDAPEPQRGRGEMER